MQQGAFDLDRRTETDKSGGTMITTYRAIGPKEAVLWHGSALALRALYWMTRQGDRLTDWLDRRAVAIEEWTLARWPIVQD